MTQSGTGKRTKNMTVSAATSRLISLILKMSPPEIMEVLRSIENKDLEKNRRSPRVNYFMAADYVVNERAYSGYINNISSEGVYIETKEAFNQDDEITLTFALPNSQGHIRVTGKIVRITPEGIGIAFDIDIQSLLEGRENKNKGYVADTVEP